MQVDDTKANTANRPENKKEVFPACLPRVDQEYNDGNVWVAGWGLVKQKVIEGTKIQIRGLEMTPRHVDVPIRNCTDPDPYEYPKGLVCAGAPGILTT